MQALEKIWDAYEYSYVSQILKTRINTLEQSRSMKISQCASEKYKPRKTSTSATL